MQSVGNSNSLQLNKQNNKTSMKKIKSTLRDVDQEQVSFCSRVAPLCWWLPSFAVHVQLILKAPGLVKPGNHRITESVRLEKTSIILKSNPNTPHCAH